MLQRRTSLLPLTLLAAVLLASCGSGSKSASDPSTTSAAHAPGRWPKVSYELWDLLEEIERDREAAIASGRTLPPEREIQVVVVYTGGSDRLASAGIPLESIVSGLAGGHLTREQIRAAAALEWVRQVRRPTRSEPLQTL